MKKLLLLAIFFGSVSTLLAQNVGINATGAAPNGSAMLDVSSTNSGMLIPRMTQAQRNAIGAPATSLLIYQTNANPGFYYWDGAQWVRLFNGDAWQLTGNAGTNPTNNFLGTTDAQPLRIRTSNANRFEFTTDGRLRSFNTGSAGAPTYSWTNDTNTGLYRIAADVLGFSTAGTERMRIAANGNVGVGTNNPTQTLHVSGNQRLDGALMPNNNPGTQDQILISNGAGNAPGWGPGFSNTGAINGIGKYFVGPFNSNGGGTILTLTVADPNMTNTSTVSWTFVGNLPAPALVQYGANFNIITEAQAGQVVFYIFNDSPYNITNLQLSYVAYY